MLLRQPSIIKESIDDFEYFMIINTERQNASLIVETKLMKTDNTSSYRNLYNKIRLHILYQKMQMADKFKLEVQNNLLSGSE